YQLLEMYNYGRAYDFYAELGCYGPDTFGTPMLILTDWKENGEDVNNACSYGNIKGWMCFGASAIGNCEECLDVIAHEFTHGVTGTEMAGSVYSNEQGTINESFSDIMGEICEHMAIREDGKVESDDPLWYHGQNKAQPTRCASNPNAFEQPNCVGDVYYIVPSTNADSTNDNGGNHFNSSLLTYVAWKLYDAGLPLEDERDVWFTTACLMTPRNDFDEVYAALLMSMEINGIDQSYADLVDETWEELGLVGDRIANAYAYERSGFGHIKATVKVSEATKVTRIVPYEYDKADDTYYSTYMWIVPDSDGNVYGMIPEGTYALELLAVYNDSTMSRFYLQSDGSWSTDSSSFAVINMTSGGVIDLGTIS
ncbi:MAG: M4 family metallopeptidase, partial [Lachnospiraceae bacterium]|nr:M4 family metallopeptidase [Lachnospiraceae bacterium]